MSFEPKDRICIKFDELKQYHNKTAIVVDTFYNGQGQDDESKNPDSVTVQTISKGLSCWYEDEVELISRPERDHER